jgi:hypothetical protein
MDVRIEYEQAKVSFIYQGKEYLGQIVCSDTASKCYWFVFDQIEVKPFGGSIEFRTINGKLQPLQDFPDYHEFLACIRELIEQHLKELCN